MSVHLLVSFVSPTAREFELLEYSVIYWLWINALCPVSSGVASFLSILQLFYLPERVYPRPVRPGLCVLAAVIALVCCQLGLGPAG